MSIAVLAWGSLVWQPANQHGELRVAPETTWSGDGPSLPVEFARISSDGRLTLVVLPRYPHEVPVLWRTSGLADLEAAMHNLADRETRAPLAAVHAVTAGGEVRGDPDAGIVERVATWLARRHDTDAAIWTGLPPGDRWVEFGYEGFTSAAAVDYVTGLRGEVRTRALEYVRNAPRQIDTPVRRALSEIMAR